MIENNSENTQVISMLNIERYNDKQHYISFKTTHNYNKATTMTILIMFKNC